MISVEYAAGFFDGEGCVHFTTNRNAGPNLKVTIGNTFFPILDLFKQSFGGFVSEQRIHKNPKAAPARYWWLSGVAAEEFLKKIQPFSRVKSAQILLALEFMEFRKAPKETRLRRVPRTEGIWARKPETIEKEEEFKARMHTLNRRGIPLPNSQVATDSKESVSLGG